MLSELARLRAEAQGSKDSRALAPLRKAEDRVVSCPDSHRADRTQVALLEAAGSSARDLCFGIGGTWPAKATRGQAMAASRSGLVVRALALLVLLKHVPAIGASGVLFRELTRRIWVGKVGVEHVRIMSAWAAILKDELVPQCHAPNFAVACACTDAISWQLTRRSGLGQLARRGRPVIDRSLDSCYLVYRARSALDRLVCTAPAMHRSAMNMETRDRGRSVGPDDRGGIRAELRARALLVIPAVLGHERPLLAERADRRPVLVHPVDDLGARLGRGRIAAAGAETLAARSGGRLERQIGAGKGLTAVESTDERRQDWQSVSATRRVEYAPPSFLTRTLARFLVGSSGKGDDGAAGWMTGLGCESGTIGAMIGLGCEAGMTGLGCDGGTTPSAIDTACMSIAESSRSFSSSPSPSSSMIRGMYSPPSPRPWKTTPRCCETTSCVGEQPGDEGWNRARSCVANWRSACEGRGIRGGLGDRDRMPSASPPSSWKWASPIAQSNVAGACGRLRMAGGTSDARARMRRRPNGQSGLRKTSASLRCCCVGSSSTSIGASAGGISTDVVRASGRAEGTTSVAVGGTSASSWSSS